MAMLIAAYCEQVGVDPETLNSYLQIRQQHSRADGPQEEDRAHLAGLLGQAEPADTDEPGRCGCCMAAGSARHRPRSSPRTIRRCCS
ncbi:hypothetical protein [Streptomyces sp. NPDC006012]|uniref:hypothetical protein n=1 Tax=Streptomyces sp. NPDC006012 TaxID=3364739 RepID=UPI0036AF05A5